MLSIRKERWKRRILRYRKAVHGYTLYVIMVALFLWFLPIIAFSFRWQNRYFVILNLGIIIFTFCALVYLAFTKREIMDKTSWFMLILFVPFFGAFLFWFVGRSQTQPKIYQEKSQHDLQFLQKAQQQYVTELPDELKQMQLLAPYSQFTTKNQQQFLTGQAVYDAMLKDIKRAKHHIHLEMYIVRYDTTTIPLFDALVEKVQAGVEVRLLLDVFGTLFLRDKNVEKLIDAGVEIVFFNQQTRQFLDHSHVNHRKNLVIDGQVAYTGGFNFGAEYVHGYPDKHLKWYDMMTRIQGNLVQSIQQMFLLDWVFSLDIDVRQFLKNDAYFPQMKQTKAVNGTVTQFISDGPDREGNAIKDTLRQLIRQAKERIYFTTPYLIPPDDILNDLKLAALSGVDVRIIIPDVPDKKIVYFATESHVEELLKVGIRIYKMTGYFVHSKLYVFDHLTTMYGTANLDMRSFFLNLEANVIAYNDAKLNKQAMVLLHAALEQAKELRYVKWRQRPWWKKGLEKIIGVLNPLF